MKTLIALAKGLNCTLEELTGIESFKKARRRKAIKAGKGIHRNI